MAAQITLEGAFGAEAYLTADEARMIPSFSSALQSGSERIKAEHLHVDILNHCVQYCRLSRAAPIIDGAPAPKWFKEFNGLKVRVYSSYDVVDHLGQSGGCALLRSSHLPPPPPIPARTAHNIITTTDPHLRKEPGLFKRVVFR